MKDFEKRLKEETLELARKLNSLNDFMRTEFFYGLDRASKDLLYEQNRIMNSYIQILGKRCELLGISLKEEIKNKENVKEIK